MFIIAKKLSKRDRMHAQNCVRMHIFVVVVDCYYKNNLSLNSPSSLSRLAHADTVCALLTVQPYDSMENLLHVQRLTNALWQNKNELLL